MGFSQVESSGGLDCPECGAAVSQPVRGPRVKYCSLRCRKRANAAADLLHLAKVQKLGIAGTVAPVLRKNGDRRRITVVSQSGETIRTISDRDLAMSILGRVGIEFQLESGRKEIAVCESCSKTFRPGKRRCQTRCLACRCPLCAKGCGRRVPAKSQHAHMVAKRNGRPAMCLECAREELVRRNAERGTGKTSKVCACGGSKSRSSKACAKCLALSRPAKPMCACGATLIHGNKSGKCRKCFTSSPEFYMAGVRARRHQL